MDCLFYNAKIDTRDGAHTVAEAVGITGDRISFVGSRADGEKQNPAQRIDLEGAYVLPGFSDSHLHMLNYAFVESCYKMNGFTSIREIQEKARVYGAERGISGEKWLFGRGWNHEIFTDEHRFLTRQDLDEISTDYPVYFIRTCGHVAAGNTKAVERIMAMDKTKDYLQFIDAEKGVFLEASAKLAYDAMTPPTQSEVETLIELGARDLNACGITAIQTDDFLSLPGRDPQTIINAYNNLQCKGRMNIRVYEHSVFSCREDMERYLGWGYRTGMGGPYYKLGPIKLLQDGSIGAHTALLRAPYANGDHELGLQIHKTETFFALVQEAHDAGMQIAVHTIGDGALEMFIDAVEAAQKKNPRKDCRHGAVHAQITDRGLIERMAKDGILAYIQPVFIEDDMGVVERCVGDERTAGSYAWKTMLELGVHASGGSDAPVVRFNTLENMQMAVTRQKLDNTPEGGWIPDQKLTIDETIDLFTKAAAYSSFEEDVRGTVEVGKYADLVVLGRDLHQVEPTQIKNVPVLRTVIGGRTVYQAN
ncbi:MAG: amidohydrolase [Oscillospiraceae bacterium]